jgi:hypothetical protein
LALFALFSWSYAFWGLDKLFCWGSGGFVERRSV